mmetsp:Transcript_3321/g.10906  ORF Transcript_3321/g.10906 Transcript_3321/m.10906 type:complete len:241 (+) Transcript_3321:283-1005(+)
MRDDPMACRRYCACNGTWNLLVRMAASKAGFSAATSMQAIASQRHSHSSTRNSKTLAPCALRHEGAASSSALCGASCCISHRTVATVPVSTAAGSNSLLVHAYPWSSSHSMTCTWPRRAALFIGSAKGVTSCAVIQLSRSTLPDATALSKACEVTSQPRLCSDVTSSVEPDDAACSMYESVSLGQTSDRIHSEKATRPRDKAAGRYRSHVHRSPSTAFAVAIAPPAATARLNCGPWRKWP